MDIISDLSIDQLIGLYIVIGLCMLLSALRAGLKDSFEREEIRERLGIVVLITVFAWPYNLVCWIFSWPIWLRSVSDFLPRDFFSVNITLAIFMSLFMVLVMHAFGVIELSLS